MRITWDHLKNTSAYPFSPPLKFMFSSYRVGSYSASEFKQVMTSQCRMLSPQSVLARSSESCSRPCPDLLAHTCLTSTCQPCVPFLRTLLCPRAVLPQQQHRAPRELTPPKNSPEPMLTGSGYKDGTAFPGPCTDVRAGPRRS